MKLLAIDSSTGACSAALLMNGVTIERYELAPRQQMRLLFPMISELLSEARIQLEQLDAIAFAHGPGSFTGIRIAASIVQGLAFAVSLPVISVSTLEVLAQLAIDEYKADHILVALDARMGEIYWGVYRKDNEGLAMPISSDSLLRPDAISLSEGGSWFAIGDAWGVYCDVMQERCGRNIFATAVDCYPHARYVAKLARAMLTKGELKTAERALPLYLRGKSAWVVS